MKSMRAEVVIRVGLLDESDYQSGGGEGWGQACCRRCRTP